MKRLIALLMALALLLTAAALSESDLVEDWPVDDDPENSWSDAAEGVGEWEILDISEAKGNDTLRALLAKAVEGMSDVTYTPAALLATQTGGGMNYCILCHCAYTASGSGETGWSLVYLSQTLGEEAKVTNIVPLDIASLSDYGIFH